MKELININNIYFRKLRRQKKVKDVLSTILLAILCFITYCIVINFVLYLFIKYMNLC